MQRDAITLDELADRDNLLQATWRSARGKRERPAVARFLRHLDARLNTLAQAILEEHAPLGRFRRFTIHDPKRRVITAACFADRVLHHAILNLAEPRFERMLVESSYACRPGKGVHAAVVAVQRNLRRWSWVVQVDIDGYFPSIDHAMLKSLLSQRFKGKAFLALLGRIIDAGGHDHAGCGLPIGSLTSQHFANAYLDAADRFLLGHPGVRAHVRYMDDILWWCSSRDDAYATLDELRVFLWQARRLCLKPRVHIGRSRRGLSYCGFRIRPGVVLASSRKLARFRAGLARIDTALIRGMADEMQVQRASTDLLATLTGTQTLGFRQRLIKLSDNDKVDDDDYPAHSGCGSR